MVRVNEGSGGGEEMKYTSTPVSNTLRKCGYLAKRAACSRSMSGSMVRGLVVIVRGDEAM